MTDLNISELSLHAEELESLDAQWDWGNFFTGVGVGLTLVGIVVGVALT
jgi:hypothetical protein